MVVKFVVRYGKRVWFWHDLCLWCGNSTLKDFVPDFVGKNTSAASYLGSSGGDYANDQSLLCVHIPRLGIRIICRISDLYTLIFLLGEGCLRLKGSIKFDVRSFYDA